VGEIIYLDRFYSEWLKENPGVIGWGGFDPTMVSGLYPNEVSNGRELCSACSSFYMFGSRL
jgi:hypothetical protein